METRMVAFLRSAGRVYFYMGAWGGLQELHGIFHESLIYMPRVEMHHKVIYDLYTPGSMRI